MVKISVIIPTYNRKNTIIRAINSVLSQSIQPHEIFICDDGSTDETEKIVKEIKDRRIKWLPGKHTGLPAVPRNKGIKESKGEWLAFLDSDDWWFPKKLERQLLLAQHKGLLAVSSNCLLIRQKNNFGKMLNIRKNVINFLDLINTNYIICSSAIIHRSLLKKCKGFPENSSLKAIEDYAFWLRIATQTSFGYISHPLVNYSDNNKSVRTQAPKTLIEQKVIVYANFLKWIKHMNDLIDYRKEVEKVLNYLYS